MGRAPVNKYSVVIPAITEKVRKGVLAAGLMVEHGAKEKAPVLTGNHRRSIYTEVTDTATGVVARVTHRSDYGGFLELGTSRMSARPHFRPALDEARPKLAQVIAKGGE